MQSETVRPDDLLVLVKDIPEGFAFGLGGRVGIRLAGEQAIILPFGLTNVGYVLSSADFHGLKAKVLPRGTVIKLTQE